ncbi:11680_t:CDS:2 [Scutellospora calospora]|uniref:11680_t:CDS:1 n=1 Tax=Scutellospora calospora TaxID=85575 RepID=A0ACA9JUW0_9GLOM|nr:11680_t:CDS:2 [Scutellospora calospora]
MPNMNGYELLDELRSNKKTQFIPVILLSAKADVESKIKGLNNGADDYLIKPFSSRELITRIRTNIKLSFLRRKIIFEQCKQEEIKQLLLSISNMILSGLSMKETLQYVVKEINHKLPSERIFIISNEKIESKNQIIALYEDPNPPMDISDNNEIKSQTFYNNSRIDISLDIYCDDVQKNVSKLSVEIRLNNDFWGWIIAYRSPNSIWYDFEIELLEQVSNQISLAITHAELLEENLLKKIQIKAADAANVAKSQILANTSHGAIVGLLSSFESANLTVEQRDMINILSRASETVLSIVNDILDVAKLEAHKITLDSRIFDLYELIDNIIETFEKEAGDKKIEIIVNYDMDVLPKYVKSDPDRLKQVLSQLLSNSIKFTEKGEIGLKLSIQSQKIIDEIKESTTYANLLIELYDTGIGMNPEYIPDSWKSFSKGDMSITRKQDGTGLGLSICKSLVEINGGEIKAESQLGKGSKFWFTWNVALLDTQFDKLMSDKLPDIKQKRILIIHPIEGARNAILKFLKKAKKVDAFDTFDEGIKAAKAYKEWSEQFAYDIVFIRLYENNEEETMKTEDTKV